MQKQKVSRRAISRVLLYAILLFAPLTLSAEKISEFDSTITLHENDTITIKEEITYDSEELSKHGIYRDIPLDTIKDSPINRHRVSIISITDENGNRVPYEVSAIITGGQGIKRIKIGNKNVTFQGVKKYVISYDFTHALSQKDGNPYLYFNITGNAWPFMIEKSKVSINSNTENAIIGTEGVKCFTGFFGESKDCSLQNEIKNSGIYQANFIERLMPGQGITLFVPLTYTTSPFPSRRFVWFINHLDALLFPSLSLLFIFGTLFLYRKYGKDPDDGRVVVAEYTPPKNVSLLEASYILYEKIIPKSIGAQLVEEARVGNLSIEAKENNELIGFFKKISFSIKVLKIPEDAVAKTLLSSLSRSLKNVFESNSSNKFFVKILPANYSSEAPTISLGEPINLSKSTITQNELFNIEELIKESVLNKKFFDRIFLHSFTGRSERSQSYKKGGFKIFLHTIPPVLFMLFFFFIVSGGYTLGSVLYPIGFLVVCIISTISLVRSLNRKTLYGVDMKYHLLGLKKYIDIAEEERIAFHNQPSKTPEFYLELLPWAMLFGLEKKWSKEFEGVSFAESDASFYHSSIPFTATSFVNTLGSSMESFSVVASQAATVATSGGGGGSSGGGGGGGGGGSW